MKLIIPKQKATIDVVEKVLKIFYNYENDENKNITNEILKTKLINEGITVKDNAALVKQSEMLRYFGLVYYDYKSKESRITKSGIDFYTAYINNRYDITNTIIAESIIKDVFGIGADKGGNTAIEGSDSVMDPPKLFVRAIAELNGVTSKEFTYLIYETAYENYSFYAACSRMVMLENQGKNLKKELKKFETKKGNLTHEDPKINVFLENIHFCYKDKNKKYVFSTYVKQKYGEIFSALNIFNREIYEEKLIVSNNDIDLKGDIDCGIDYKNAVIDEENYELNSIDFKKQNNRKPRMIRTKSGITYKVNPKLGKTQQKLVGYKCEMDEKHITFETRGKREKSKHQFMESHHLIPMKAQNEYKEINLDRIENIICLCPNCHSQIHYGTEVEKKKVLYTLYAKRFNEIKKETSINMTVDDLFEKFYKK